MTTTSTPPKANPLRNSNKLKLGIFSTNGSGAAFTNHPDRFTPTWENNVRIAQLADSLGLEAFVPFARWKSFAGDGHYSGSTMETFTWAAGIAAVTQQICVMSTVHVSVFHPLVAAKSSATIDLISNGRLGLNLVCGWYRPEIEMFGNGMNTHEDRYGLADEWVEIVDRLWTEKLSFDYSGRFYELKGAISDPKPVQTRPVLMNAGGSQRGREFAAKHCDVAFVLAFDTRPEAVKKQVDQYRQLAREKYGKDIQIWMSSYVVQRNSLEEAQAYVENYVIDQGDEAGVEGFISNNIANAKTVPDGVMEKMRYAIKAGVGGYPLLGTAADIANTLSTLSEAGVDGILLTWLDYEGGLRTFGETVLPLLEEHGLRAPAGAWG